VLLGFSFCYLESGIINRLNGSAPDSTNRSAWTLQNTCFKLYFVNFWHRLNHKHTHTHRHPVHTVSAVINSTWNCNTHTHTCARTHRDPVYIVRKCCWAVYSSWLNPCCVKSGTINSFLNELNSSAPDSLNIFTRLSSYVQSTHYHHVVRLSVKKNLQKCSTSDTSTIDISYWTTIPSSAFPISVHSNFTISNFHTDTFIFLLVVKKREYSYVFWWILYIHQLLKIHCSIWTHFCHYKKENWKTAIIVRLVYGNILILFLNWIFWVSFSCTSLWKALQTHHAGRLVKVDQRNYIFYFYYVWKQFIV